MSALDHIGLTQREIAVYTALLELGSSTTGPLSKKSGVPSARIYEVLARLQTKGLANHVVKGKVKYFQANNPKQLLHIHEEQERGLVEEVKKLEELQRAHKPTYMATVHEGIRSIKAIMLDLYATLDGKKEYCVFPLGEELETEELRIFWAQLFHTREKKNIAIRTMPHRKLRRTFEKHYVGYKKVKVRYTDQRFPSGIFIFPDHVLQVTWHPKPVAFLIQSRETAQTWQAFFEEQWERAKQ